MSSNLSSTDENNEMSSILSSNNENHEMSSNLLDITSPIPHNKEFAQMFSCSICLEIFFEPCTTSCGHSFCKKCLQFAIDKSGQRCPICRKWIRGESSDVNIVLWNTIQLMFPSEVEARKASDALSSQASENSNRPFFGRRNFQVLLGISMSAVSLLVIDRRALARSVLRALTQEARRGTFNFQIKTENFEFGYTHAT